MTIEEKKHLIKINNNNIESNATDTPFLSRPSLTMIVGIGPISDMNI